MTHTSPESLTAGVLLSLGVIVVAARFAGALFRRLRQPPVIGELCVGLFLGPTVVGALPGHLTGVLFPAASRPVLTAVGNLGLVLFMFLMGHGVDAGALSRRKGAATSIGSAATAVPFILGLLLAGTLVSGDPHAHGGVAFTLFVATAMSVTAFPVLARVLVDAGIERTQLGVLALSAAALQEVFAWGMLAVVLSIASAGGVMDLPRILAELAALAALLLAVVRPLLGRALRRLEPGSSTVLAVAVAGAGLAAWATHAIGLHFVLGAFLFGLAFPRERGLPGELEHRLAPLTNSALLPVFFIVPGLAVNLRGIGLSGVEQLAAILLVACAGKLAGAAFAARASGLAWRETAAIAALMNTRGLVELIVLNVGLSAGIVDRSLYGMFVVMALVTTAMAGPLLRAIYRGQPLQDELAPERPARPAGRLALGAAEAAP